MKEVLKNVEIEGLPGTREEYREMMLRLSATPEGTAAAFVVALEITARDRETGYACISDICIDPPGNDVLDAVLPGDNVLKEVASSYVRLKGDSADDGPRTIMIKLTDEKPLKRHVKTVYVGCSGTSSYRPLTLISKPPRFLKKRFGVKREYYEDPWFVLDFPSMILPVLRGMG